MTNGLMVTHPTKAADPRPTMVRLEGVRKCYGLVTALDTTDLEICKGEFVTLLGPSGSGKTTFLNMIAGMAAPSAGRIIIDGRDVTMVPPEKRGIGMVFQNYALMPHMTVFENIAFPLQIRRVNKSEIKRRVTEVTELMRLPNVAQRKPKELSGGQQQRVSIARCIVYNPSLILMDEPLGALDKKLREQMQLEIKRIHKELGITMLYVTHDQEEALNMSDRIALMKEGRIVQLATPHELYFEPNSQFAADFIGQSTLIDAEVIKAGSPHVLRLETGTTCQLAGGSCLEGARGKLLLRPETLRIVQNGEAPADHNMLRGTLAETFITGGTAKHFVTLANGKNIIIQELTNRSMTCFATSQAVNVVWPFEAGRFLER